MTMASSVRKSVQLYYDVISPHAWITFEQLLKYKTPWQLDVILKPFSLVGVLVAANKGYAGDVHVKLQRSNEDVELLGKYYGIPIKIPTNGYKTTFKRGTLSAMRLLTAAEQIAPDLTEILSRSLWMRLWSKDLDITERESLIQAGKDVGIPESDMKYLLLKSKEKCTTVRLRSVTDEALLNGVFGAPTLVIGDKNNKAHVLSGADGMHSLAVLLGKKYDYPVNKHDLFGDIDSSQPGAYKSMPSSIRGDKMRKPV